MDTGGRAAYLIPQYIASNNPITSRGVVANGTVGNDSNVLPCLECEGPRRSQKTFELLVRLPPRSENAVTCRDEGDVAIGKPGTRTLGGEGADIPDEDMKARSAVSTVGGGFQVCDPFGLLRVRS